MRHVLTTVTLTVAVVACSSQHPQQQAMLPSATNSGGIAWGPCTDVTRPGGQTPTRQESTMQCGKLAVPLDYAKPEAGTIEMAVIKIPATGPGKRLGSLVFNFGGPGASGVDTMAQAAKAFPRLNTQYDLVSFDPRGVQRSAGVRCGTSAEMDRWVSMDTIPVNEKTRAESTAANKEFARLCAQDSGKLLPYVGTVNAARDMDRLRAALGEEKLNYFGMSYGTQLGAVYATLFPKLVGQTVLDAPLDPTVNFEQRNLAQTAGFQQAYESFLKSCVKDGCPFGKTVQEADANVNKLMNDLVTQPIKVGTRELTQGLASTGLAAALYSQLSWPFLEQSLNQAMHGQGEGLMYLADTYAGRKQDGTYTTEMTSFPAITCVDSAERPSEAELRKSEAASLKISPLFGSEGAGGLCRLWPVPGSNQARHVDATGSGPIVVVGGTGDPATPYQWAPKLTSQLKTATLVTYKGEGHGAYLSGDKCVQNVVDAYLLNGTVPKQGTTCGTK
ncbi:alpha/beta hydrolase [Nonomuraea sediminis]|uniref:alpha/beta hydrolase n=1 Tax=Nonomuraea sediminis TaxID=2835864 RepID=UPI001BDD9767|nr:alpha/beta fold hydrolase [Nonomuraea sediminis]